MRFFDDADMDFALRCVLSGVRHGMAEVGEAFTTAARITDGDPASWLEAFVTLGRRSHAAAAVAGAAGHTYSAWNAALRAANYLYAGLWWAPATDRATEQDELWEEHRASWELAVEHWPSPVGSIAVPHGDTALPGLWFSSPSAGTEPAPAVVLVPGLGTPISDVCMTGLDGALSRGHHVLVVEGPGQGAALHRQHLHLDHSWPQLVMDALDVVAAMEEVDGSSVSLVGVGAGALFAAQGASLCGRRRGSTAARPAALVLDPPAMDLGADAAAAVAAATDERTRRLLTATTTGPTGTADLASAVEALAGHTIGPSALGSIECPTLLVTADGAFGFRGQEEALLASLRCEHRRIVLRSADGAGADNGIDASQVHDAAVYDWLDATLERDLAAGREQDGGRDG